MFNKKMFVDVLLFTIAMSLFLVGIFAIITILQKERFYAGEIPATTYIVLQERVCLISKSYDEVVEPQDISLNFNILKPSGYTSEELMSALSSENHKEMIPYIYAFINAEKEYGINAFYLMCKLGLESGWGRYTSGNNNIAGWTNNNGSYKDFDSVEDCIMHVASNLSTTYITKVGTRLEDVCKRYCPDDKYVKTLMQIMVERQYKIDGFKSMGIVSDKILVL